MVRDLQLSDIVRLEQMHNSDFPLPNLNDRRYFSQKVVGDLDAVGILKLTTEAIIIMNQGVSRLTRARALSELILELKKELLRFNLDDTHVFLLDPESNKTERILIKHFNFLPASGKALYLGV